MQKFCNSKNVIIFVSDMRNTIYVFDNKFIVSYDLVELQYNAAKVEELYSSIDFTFEKGDLSHMSNDERYDVITQVTEMFELKPTKIVYNYEQI